MKYVLFTLLASAAWVRDDTALGTLLDKLAFESVPRDEDFLLVKHLQTEWQKSDYAIAKLDEIIHREGLAE